jgi:hypothetical protein
MDGITIQQFKRTYGNNYSINFPNCLKNSIDFKVVNYSNFYLTSKYLFSDIFTVESEKFKSTNIITNIIIGGNYLTFSKIDTTPYILTGNPKKARNYGIGIFSKTEPADKFNLVILPNNRCQIYYKTSENVKYYLIADTSNNVFFVNETELTFNSSYINPQDFSYMFSEYANNMLFFKKTETGTYILSKRGIYLTLNLNTSSYVGNPFKISRNIYTYPHISLNTSFVTYNNDYTINQSKSIFELKNNFLMNRKYSEYDGVSDILILKNQLTELDVFSNANNLLSGMPEDYYIENFRDYTSILESIPKETSDELELNYTFDNKTYKIVPGDNIITSPPTMFPFSKMNINDTKFIKAGAFPHITPDYADKVYKLSNNPTHLKEGQHLLCTWLYADPNTNQPIWVDRYYYPDLIEKEAAMQGYPMFINTPTDEYIESIINSNLENKNNISTTKFFDKQSDLLIEPNTKYKYSRLSPEYTPPTYYKRCYSPEELAYPTNYFKTINNSNKFTVSFDFIGDDSYWIIESDHNEIQSKLKITKNGYVLIIEYTIYDPTTERYISFNNICNIKALKYNFLAISVDGISGFGYFFFNNTTVSTFKLSPYNYINKQLLYGDLFLLKDDTKINIMISPPSELRNVNIKDEYITPQLAALYPIFNNNLKVDDLYITLPAGMRNTNDSIELLQQICSNSTFKSNNVNIILKNLYNISPTVKTGVEDYIRTTISNMLPSNTVIKDIQFKNFK